MAPGSPEPPRASPTRACLDTLIVMKKHSLCKNEIINSLQAAIRSRYARLAFSFQHSHNASHPDRRIWRHMLCPRTFIFFRSGETVKVTVDIVRFIYVGTHRTFTFYADLFLPFSRYPAELVRSAISLPKSDQAFCVSRDTLSRWRRLPLPADGQMTTSLPLPGGADGCYNCT